MAILVRLLHLPMPHVTADPARFAAEVRDPRPPGTDASGFSGARRWYMGHFGRADFAEDDVKDVGGKYWCSYGRTHLWRGSGRLASGLTLAI